jgi:hypothetical protein
MGKVWRGIVLGGLLGGSAACQPAQTSGMLGTSAPQIAIARTTCADVMGIREGFVPHEACVESLARSMMSRAENPSAQTAGAKNYSGDPVIQKPYVESTNREIRAKEEYSCARIGFVPGTAGFISCVTELHASLLSEQRPE